MVISDGFENDISSVSGREESEENLVVKNSLSLFGVKLWNEITCHIRDLPKKEFTKVLHRLLSDTLKRQNDHIDYAVDNLKS